MNAVYILWSLMAIILVFQPSGEQYQNPCVSPQYLEFGEPGTISCIFPDAIFTLLWYDTANYLHSEPVLQYSNAIKTGFGYESGEYDINPNGSLTINEVSMQHYRTFTVVCVRTKEDIPTSFEIKVIVTQDNLARCPSSQYGHVGDRAIIRCSITVNFESISWYKEDIDDAIVAYDRKLTRSTSAAPEYDNDEYGLLIDGSLIIYEVGPERSNVKYTVELIDNATVGHLSQTVEFVAMDRILTNTSTAAVPPADYKSTTLYSSTDVSEPSTQSIVPQEHLGVLWIITIMIILLLGVLVVVIIGICIFQRKVPSRCKQVHNAFPGVADS